MSMFKTRLSGKIECGRKLYNFMNMLEKDTSKGKLVISPFPLI